MFYFLLRHSPLPNSHTAREHWTSFWLENEQALGKNNLIKQFNPGRKNLADISNQVTRLKAIWDRAWCSNVVGEAASNSFHIVFQIRTARVLKPVTTTLQRSLSTIKPTTPSRELNTLLCNTTLHFSFSIEAELMQSAGLLLPHNLHSHNLNQLSQLHLTVTC